MTTQQLHDRLTAPEMTARARLTDLIENTDELTATLQEWLRIPLDHHLHRHELRPPTSPERDALQLHSSTLHVLAREGVLRAAIPASDELVVARVSAVIARQRLPQPARSALDLGELPLGAILRRHLVRRHTHVADPAEGSDSTGRAQLLQVRATLTIPGRGRVAVVDETIYLALLRPG
ncbi:hypothetical protein [Lentzea jiangxiensis]|uniref:Chorismate lyase n=1 Tax=Lentzea jiangxiensis TaxID=641025 RepID=A0A1H0UH35_9PSEU|nr:hypothetical protein [Lentzea jiangxiensis]SDP65443.1 hypothetical protein SAMN05421507_1125 [Lentzea jiangxiensis]